MSIDRMQHVLDGKGRTYSEPQIAAARQAYGSHLPAWYADLWRTRAIFEADAYVFDPRELHPVEQVLRVRLYGPDDGGKLQQHQAVLAAGYFVIGELNGPDKLLLVDTRSRGPGAQIRQLSARSLDKPEWLDRVGKIHTFRQLAARVVDWPILGVVDTWRQTYHWRANLRGDSRGWGWLDVMAALSGGKRALPAGPGLERLVMRILAAYKGTLAAQRKLLTQGGITNLPTYRARDIPTALKIFWGFVNKYPLEPVSEIVFGTKLLRIMQQAKTEGLPEQLIVFGRADDEYLCVDRSATRGETDAAVVTWPAGRHVADSLAEWAAGRIEAVRGDVLASAEAVLGRPPENEAAAKYGPGWQLVQTYIAVVPRGFLLNRLGEPDEADPQVRRLRNWDELRQEVNYDFDDASPETCPYLRFLGLCHTQHEANEALAKEAGLEDQLGEACTDAANRYVEDGEGSDERWLEVVMSEPYERPYPYCEYSIQDHCTYIAAELVVAHLKDVHLLQDMWYWYRRGHWPCGWEGDWPEGRLIVF